MGRYENFYICVSGEDITNDEEVSLFDVQIGNEERPQVLDALDEELISVDAEEWILYCERSFRGGEKMNEHEITEQAYRNGYEAGVKSCKAEIERLEERSRKLMEVIEIINDETDPSPFAELFNIDIKTAKANAVKEFAERLKTRRNWDIGFPDYVFVFDIDYLVKELTEGKE